MTSVVERREAGSEEYSRGQELFKEQKYPEAERLLREAIRQQERVFGVVHENTLDSKYWLSRTLHELERYKEAELLLRESIRQRERLCGAEHENTLLCKYRLAITLHRQEKYDDAVQLLRESVRQEEKILGVEHPDTLNSKYQLAITLQKQKTHEDAERLLRELIRQEEKTFGVEHPNTLNSKHQLAITLYELKKYEEAEQSLRGSIRQEQKVLGEEHLDTLSSKFWLGVTLYRRKAYEEAEQLLRASAQQEVKMLGAEHKNTLYSKYWLAATLHQQKQYEEAEQLLRESAPRQERALGVEHEHTLRTKFQLGAILYDQEKYEEAERLLRESVQQREKVLGAEHEDTLESQRRLQDSSLALASLASSSALAFTRLGDYFVQGDGDRIPYTDSEISQISGLLLHIHPSWAKITRTYIVLRSIACLSLIDVFLDAGFSDYWFPVTERTLPESLRPSQRAKFVDAQKLIMTKSMDLEKGEKGEHRHFNRGETLPFEEKGILGLGGFGQVDKVLSLISFQEYARKRVSRKTAFSGRRAEDVKRFIAEIQVLKRLKHRHIVEFVGSYTDPKYIALIMSPVADMDLNAYLMRADAGRYGELRTFFGCLARALAFLHEQNIRHKDVKPANILVHRGSVLFTDFGLAFDFTEVEASTTVGVVNGMTAKYCAPEVMLMEPRNTSSDIWSLGVVFLEMTATLKGKTVDRMYQFLEEHGSRQAFVRTNPTGLDELLAELRRSGSAHDNVALEWVQRMLSTPAWLRPTAAVLVASIAASGRDGEKTTAFCGICCSVDDDSDESNSLDDVLMGDY